jgi:hypothetical protein
LRDVGTARKDGIDGGRLRGDFRDSDGDYAGGDDGSDGRGVCGRGRGAGEIVAAVFDVLGVDVHTLPCTLDGSLTVVFVACSWDSGSDGQRSEGDDGEDGSKHCVQR